MKKFLSTLLVLCMVFSMGVTALADGIKITVDGALVDCALYGQEPVIVEGRTLVPLRSVFEALGAFVNWNNEEREVVSQRGDVNISLKVDSTQLVVNGQVKTLDVPACILNNRTMVPVRAVAEAFGCTVEWENDTKTVVIKTNSEPSAGNNSLLKGAEAAVNDMYACLKAGNLEGATKYLQGDKGILEGLNLGTDMESFYESILSVADTSMYTEDQLKRMIGCASTLVNSIFNSIDYKVLSSEMVNDNTVMVQVEFTLADFENLDFSFVQSDETVMKVLNDVMKDFGYTEEALETLSQEEEAAFMTEYELRLYEYVYSEMAKVITAAPKMNPQVETVNVSLINGNWFVNE